MGLSGVALAGPTVETVVSVPGAGDGSPLLVVLSAGAVMLFAAVLVAMALRRNAQPSDALNRFLPETDWPAAIAAVGGDLLGTNAAATDQAAAGTTWPLLSLLDRYIQITGPELYRATRLCVDSGLVIEFFDSSTDEIKSILVGQRLSGKAILWQILPETHMASLFPAHAANSHDRLPFGYVRLEAGRETQRNRRFGSTYGTGAVAALQQALGQAEDPDAPEVYGTTVLPGVEGEGVRSGYACKRYNIGERRVVDAFLTPQTQQSVADIAAAETLDLLPVSLVGLTLEGRIEWGNAQARRMLGPAFETGARLSRSVETFGRSFDALIEEVLEGENEGGSEMARLDKGGSDVFIQIAVSQVHLRAEDKLLAVLTDASELRQLEDKFAQSSKMEAVGKLAGGVAHDFNNVLTAISGNCDLLLLRKDASHPDFSDLTQIRQNATRAAGLVRQLLAFSRKQTLQPTLLSVQDVVTDTLYLLDRLIGETVSLTLDHGHELGSVRADHQQLEQALINLVVNARDAMPDGGNVVISTSNRREIEEVSHAGVVIPAGDYVEISISDNGTGIDQKVIGNVFDPFFTTKPKGEGTGLGLSTVYGIVKQSGGYIFVQNRLEGGARFSVYLPRVYPDERELALASTKEAVTASEDQTGEGTVLLVEDEAPVRSFASRALRLRGYQVLEADCAEAGMEILRDTDEVIDVIVSDVVMPGMDGPTFAGEARRVRPGLRVVFVSGYAEESFRRNLTEDDFLFLPKPFTLNDLTGKVKEALSAPPPASTVTQGEAEPTAPVP